MSLRDHPCYSELADEVTSFARGRQVAEIVNTGNWGDALIHAGQAQFLKDIGITPRRFSIFRLLNMPRYKFLLATKVLWPRALVTGNGAFQPFYDRPKQITSVARSFSRTLVMPSSFHMTPDFDLERTRLWRRDNMASAAVLPDARFCHDMAFYLTPAPRTPTQKIGNFFRADVEHGDYDVPAGNVDLSAQGTHLSDHEEFLDRIGQYEVIFTDRLHVGIGAALLGREVHLFASGTKKIQSIYETSLKPFYDNVHFQTASPISVLRRIE